VPSRRVLVVDDHRAYHESVGELLLRGGFEVVGAAFDGWQALDECRRLVPDVVLLDVQLPGLDGFEVAERLSQQEPRPVVVLISAREAVTYGDRVGHAPVAGFLQKRVLSGAALGQLLG
jgi:two-component system, NarL family, nitrate/nitrite response regulator NarL